MYPISKQKVRWCLSRFYYKNSWNLIGFSHLQTSEARWWVCYWFKSNSRLRFCDCCCAFAFLFTIKLSTFWFDIECYVSKSTFFCTCIHLCSRMIGDSRQLMHYNSTKVNMYRETATSNEFISFTYLKFIKKWKKMREKVTHLNNFANLDLIKHLIQIQDCNQNETYFITIYILVNVAIKTDFA